MNIGEQFRRYVAAKGEERTGEGERLADEFINPEKYRRKKVLKSALKKIRKGGRITSGLKRFGKKRVSRFPIKIRKSKRMTVRI